MLKNKEGLTREQAQRIFQRYHGPSQKEAEAPDSPEDLSGASVVERQTRQIHQILQYMEQTTQRLNLIENDISYIKEKVDLILQRL